MSDIIGGSRMAANDALAAALHAARLWPHKAEVVRDRFWEDRDDVRSLSYTVWVTGLDGVLDHEVFEFPINTPDPARSRDPEGAREVFVDVVVVRHGNAWDLCHVRIRTALGAHAFDPPHKYWNFALNRASRSSRIRRLHWHTFEQRHIPQRAQAAA